MKLLNIRTVLVLLATTVAAAFASPSYAQDYPNRPVRIIDPYVPGGSTDRSLRPLVAKLSEILGQTVFIEHKPGAGTNIGSEFVAKSKPDGYTVLLGTTSLATSPSVYKKLNYDPVNDLQPVVLLLQDPFVLTVSGSLPVKSVQELLDYARANPGKLNYGSSGTGGVIHLGVESLKSLTKIDMVHVPFKGSGDALNAMLGGSIQVMLSPPANFLQHVKSGRVRMLAIASTRRVSGVDLPTMTEAGVPGFTSGVWLGFFMPTGTPRPVMERFNAAVNQALKEGVAETYQKFGITPEGGSVDDFKRMYMDEIQRWQKVVRESNLKLD